MASVPGSPVGMSGAELDGDEQGVDSCLVDCRGKVGPAPGDTGVGARLVVGGERCGDAVLPPVEVDDQPGSARRIEAGWDVNGDVGVCRARERSGPELVEERPGQRVARAFTRRARHDHPRRPRRARRGFEERRVERGDRSDCQSSEQTRSLHHVDVGSVGMGVAVASRRFRERFGRARGRPGYLNRESRLQSSRNLPGSSRVGASGRRFVSPRAGRVSLSSGVRRGFLRRGDPCK